MGSKEKELFGLRRGAKFMICNDRYLSIYIEWLILIALIIIAFSTVYDQGEFEFRLGYLELDDWKPVSILSGLYFGFKALRLLGDGVEAAIKATTTKYFAPKSQAGDIDHA